MNYEGPFLQDDTRGKGRYNKNDTYLINYPNITGSDKYLPHGHQLKSNESMRLMPFAGQQRGNEHWNILSPSEKAQFLLPVEVNLPTERNIYNNTYQDGVRKDLTNLPAAKGAQTRISDTDFFRLMKRFGYSTDGDQDNNQDKDGDPDDVPRRNPFGNKSISEDALNESGRLEAEGRRSDVAELARGSIGNVSKKIETLENFFIQLGGNASLSELEKKGQNNTNPEIAPLAGGGGQQGLTINILENAPEADNEADNEELKDAPDEKDEGPKEIAIFDSDLNNTFSILDQIIDTPKGDPLEKHFIELLQKKEKGEPIKASKFYGDVFKNINENQMKPIDEAANDILIASPSKGGNSKKEIFARRVYYQKITLLLLKADSNIDTGILDQLKGVHKDVLANNYDGDNPDKWKMGNKLIDFKEINKMSDAQKFLIDYNFFTEDKLKDNYGNILRTRGGRPKGSKNKSKS